ERRHRLNKQLTSRKGPMKKQCKSLFLSIAAALALAIPVAIPAVAHAQDPIQCGIISGVQLILTGKDCSLPNSGVGGLQGLVLTVVNILSVIVGVVAVIMIIWGGFKYITSGGETGKVTSAKNTIIYAIIGLIVVAL